MYLVAEIPESYQITVGSGWAGKRHPDVSGEYQLYDFDQGRVHTKEDYEFSNLLLKVFVGQQQKHNFSGEYILSLSFIIAPPIKQ